MLGLVSGSASGNVRAAEDSDNRAALLIDAFSVALLVCAAGALPAATSTMSKRTGTVSRIGNAGPAAWAGRGPRISYRLRSRQRVIQGDGVDARPVRPEVRQAQRL